MTAIDTLTITAYGKTIDCTPCSKKHAAYFDAGYLVLSCRKCVITPTAPEGTA